MTFKISEPEDTRRNMFSKFFHRFKIELMRRALLFVLMLLISSCSKLFEGESPPDSWAYQLQNADPRETASSNFDIIVMDYSRDGTDSGAYTSSDIVLIKNAGKIPIAYLSIGEAENYRFYWQSFWDTLPPSWLGPENPNWPGNYAVRYWDTIWQRIIFTYIDRILSQGFRGLYLDKVDEFEFWSSEDSIMTEREAADRMIDFIISIANYCKSRAGTDFYIIPQNGENLIYYDNTGELLREVSGWGVEDLFYNGTLPQPSEITAERCQYLDLVKNSGRIVLSVDYVDDGTGYQEGNKTRIDDYRAKALSRGYIPYAARSDRELDELNIIDDIQH